MSKKLFDRVKIGVWGNFFVKSYTFFIPYRSVPSIKLLFKNWFLNVIILSPSSCYTPKVPLSKLTCKFENSGIDHENIKSIAKAYSSKFIFDILNNKVENWQIRAIHRDILLIVRHNLMYNSEFSKLNFDNLWWNVILLHLFIFE